MCRGLPHARAIAASATLFSDCESGGDGICARVDGKLRMNECGQGVTLIISEHV